MAARSAPLLLLLLLLSSCSAEAPSAPEPSEVASIALDPPLLVLSAGEEARLVPSARNGIGQVVSTPAVTWASTDTLAATVSTDGVVVGRGAGRTTIVASFGDVQGTTEVRVVGVNRVKSMRDEELIWMLPNRWSALFTEPAGWPSTRERVHVAKLYVDWIDSASVSTLTSAVRVMADNHIATAVELGGLRDWGCTSTIMIEVEGDKLAKLTDAGGALTYVVMDDPFGYTMERANPQGCGYSALQVSEQLVDFVRAMRSAHHGVRIGLIEPVPWFWVGEHPPHPGNDFGGLPELLDTLQTVLGAAGEQIDFFHADSPYDWTEAHPAKWDKLVDLEREVRARGLPFGLIYNTENDGFATDERFHDETLEGLKAFWAAGGTPDHFIVQSWYAVPTRMIPEGQPYTFSNVVRDFMTRYDLGPTATSVRSPPARR